MVRTVIGGDHPVWAALAGLTPAERIVLVCLAAHAGSDGRCWPSVPRLVALTGYGERHVRRALTSLRARELVEVVEWRFTSETSTVHRLTLPPVASVTGPPDVEVTGSEEPPDSDVTGPLSPVSPAPLTPGAVPPCRPGHPEEQVKNHVKDQGKNHSRALVAEVVDIASRNGTPTFEDFWDIWPKKVARRAAEKAWTTAVRRTPAERILAGVRAYAAGPLPDRKYIPYPASWLNGDRWLDDPADANPIAEPRGFAGIRAARDALNSNGHLR